VISDPFHDGRCMHRLRRGFTNVAKFEDSDSDEAQPPPSRGPGWFGLQDIC
jgi:hypothetical protein